MKFPRVAYGGVPTQVDGSDPTAPSGVGARVLAAVIMVAALAPLVAAARPRQAVIVYRHFVRKPGGAVSSLHTLDVDGGGDTWLADGAGSGHDVSPDGARIVIGGRTSVLEIMRCDGTARSEIPLPPGFSPLGPRWSPDGWQIAFESSVDGDPHIFVVDVETGQLKDLSAVAGGEMLIDSAADWSPDAARIVFESIRDREFWAEQPDAEKQKGQLTPDLHMMTADGVYLGNVTQTKNVGEMAPAWSPDGRFIAYMAMPAGAVSPHPMVWDLDTGREQRITGNDLSVLGPRWSPDGSRLLFHGRPRRNMAEHTFNMYVVDRDGGNLTQLTDFLLPEGAIVGSWFASGLGVSPAGRMWTNWGALQQRLAEAE